MADSKTAMTRDEFILGYATRIGISTDDLLKEMEPLRCDCQEEGCDGWQMAYPRKDNGGTNETEDAKT